MITGTARRAGATATASVILIGAAILRGSTAAADPSQDEQFLALLDQHGIPALENPSSLIATAQRVCGELDGGKPFDVVVESMTNFAYNGDPGRYPRDRLQRTFTRFVTAAVQAYCPYNQGKLASFSAHLAPGVNEPTYRVTGYAHTAMGGVAVANQYWGDRSDNNAPSNVRPAGETVAPQPPQLPASSPPPAHIVTPPLAPVRPQPPKQPPPVPQQQPPVPQEPPPPPQEPPPPPQQVEPPPPPQVEPPPAAPQPGGSGGGGGIGDGGGAGIGGGGSGGGGGGGGRGPSPASPPPARPMPPGVVQVAP